MNFSKTQCLEHAKYLLQYPAREVETLLESRRWLFGDWFADAIVAQFSTACAELQSESQGY